MDAQDSRPARWLALDVFRALAVLWMIQGHTFTALLRPEFYAGAWVQPYELLHGLTAPMFLLGAGIAYAVAMFGTARADGGRILRRALILFAIGTLLQLPAAPLHSLVLRRDLLIATLQPGALQLVAAGLLCAEVVRRLLRTRGRFALALGLCAVALSAAAPFVWQQHYGDRLLLGSWLDGQRGSQFPFVPWGCFLLLGAALAAAFGRSLWLRSWLMPALGLFGLLCSAGCYALFLSGERLNGFYGTHAFWYTNPMFVVFRAGLVCAWLGLLSACGRGLAALFEGSPRAAAVLRALARHSLVAYVVHLVLLYGTPFSRGLAKGGARFDFLESTLALGFVLATTVAAALAWQRWIETGVLGQRLAALAAARASAARRS